MQYLLKIRQYFLMLLIVVGSKKKTIVLNFKLDGENVLSQHHDFNLWSRLNININMITCDFTNIKFHVLTKCWGICLPGKIPAHNLRTKTSSDLIGSRQQSHLRPQSDQITIYYATATGRSKVKKPFFHIRWGQGFALFSINYYYLVCYSSPSNHATATESKKLKCNAHREH